MLLYPGEPEEAVTMAVELTMASHDDVISISGAAAVAAAVSCAFCDNCTVYDMAEAALNGAEQGYALALRQEGICTYPGPSVIKRMEIAIELCLKRSDNYIADIRDLIGCGPTIAR